MNPKQKDLLSLIGVYLGDGVMKQAAAEDYLTTLANVLRDRGEFDNLTTHDLATRFSDGHCSHPDWYIQRPERFEPLVMAVRERRCA